MIVKKWVAAIIVTQCDFKVENDEVLACNAINVPKELEGSYFIDFFDTKEEAEVEADRRST